MTDGPALAVFGHPDDAEIAVGGTLAKWAAAGRDVHLLILTNGDRGSQDAGRDRAEIAAVRAAESQAAGEILGLSSVRIFPIHDGELENTAEVRADVVRVIRELRPSTVVSCDPTAWFFESRYYNHSDHRTAGVIALDAVFPGAGNPHFFSEHLTDGLEPHDVGEIWLGWTNEPNHSEDITGFLRTKIDALAAHTSQLAEGIAFFEEELDKGAREDGEAIGVEHAEAFRRLDFG